MRNARKIGEIVKRWRKWVSLSQEALAKLAGISVRTVQRIEKGVEVDSETQRQISAAFGMTASHLVDNNPPSLPEDSDSERQMVMDGFARVHRWRDRSATKPPEEAKIIETSDVSNTLNVYAPVVGHIAASGDIGGLPVDTAPERTERQFRLRVLSESMEPTVRKGQTVLVDRHLPITPGDLVAANLAEIPTEDHWVFKRFEIKGEKMVLVSVAPGHPDIILDREPVVWHKVVASVFV